VNRWLAEESKWAREQAVKTRTRIDQLRDPEWRSKRCAMIRREMDAILAAVEKRFELAAERHILEDPDELAAHIGRLRREAESWETLAREQSARLEQTESEQDALIP
jgi:hypothetical protein